MPVSEVRAQRQDRPTENRGALLEGPSRARDRSQSLLRAEGDPLLHAWTGSRRHSLGRGPCPYKLPFRICAATLLPGYDSKGGGRTASDTKIDLVGSSSCHHHKRASRS